MRALLHKLVQRKSARDGGLVLADQGLLSLATFITMTLLARSVSKEEFGLFVLVLSALLIALGFHRALVYVPMTVFLPKLSADKQRQYLGNLSVVTAILGIFAAGVIFAVFYESGSAALFPMLAMCTTVPFILREQMRGALFARMNFRNGVRANVAATVLQIFTITALYLTGHLSAVTALLAMTICYLLAVVFLAAGMSEAPVVRLTRIREDLKRGWAVARWVLVNAIGSVGVSQSVPFMLALLVGPEAVAAYGACLSLASLPAPFLRAASAYILPSLSHDRAVSGDSTTLRRTTIRSIVVIAIPNLTWLIIGTLAAPWLIPYLYTDRYSGLQLIFFLLLIKVLIDSVSAPLVALLQAIEKPRVTTEALLLGATIMLTGGYLATSAFGLTGVCLVAVGCSVLMAAYRAVRIAIIFR